MAVSKQSLDQTHTKQFYQDMSAFCQVNSELVLHHNINPASTRVVSVPHNQGSYMKANHGMNEPYNAQTKGGRYTWRLSKPSATFRRRMPERNRTLEEDHALHTPPFPLDHHFIKPTGSLGGTQGITRDNCEDLMKNVNATLAYLES